jgi:glycosyltransferase involved in cell wall biosynthesis
MAGDLVVNGRFLGQRVTGVQRYGHEVLRTWDRMAGEGRLDRRIRVVVPRGTVAPRYANLEVRSCGSSLHGHAWEQVALPRHLGRDDTLLSLTNSGPIWVRRHALVVHDAAVFDVPQAFTWRFRAAYQVLLRAHAIGPTRFVTVSSFSRTRLAAVLPVGEEEIPVVGEGADHLGHLGAGDPAAVERLGLGSRPYVLGVSSLDPRKNFRLLTAAAADLRDIGLDVAIVGAPHGPVFRGEHEDDAVRFLGYVDDGALVALYPGAFAFVHPARYEGFGLTPLEAMSFAVPVVAADIPALRETLGSAAAFVNPERSAEVVDVLRSWLACPDERSVFVDAGRVRARHWTWDGAAERLLVAVREALP